MSFRSRFQGDGSGWEAVDVMVVPAVGGLSRYLRYMRANEFAVPALLMAVLVVVQGFLTPWRFVVVTWLFVLLGGWLFAKTALWTARRRLSKPSVVQFRAMDADVAEFGFAAKKNPAWSYDCVAVPVAEGLEVAARGQVGVRGVLHGVLVFPEWSVAIDADSEGRVHVVRLSRNGEVVLHAPALGRLPNEVLGL